ncbi:outer membrane beta-barrel protein [Maribellus sp. YY47]|uniref:outer membrane beta-barrel protein n=1 Tax=Maribellus sp. YY47 TaxID=2929486 RepID=UPI00200195A7|nr:outer membrane beta-barrel protein [Maribellus sp. YY47]MCK3684793.1 porin family protein [Maribellus sp. YY47]
MKKIVYLVIVLLLSINTMAQEADRKGYIGIMIGPSFPYGDFAGSGQFYEGYAKTGANVSLLNFGYKLWNNLGITAGWFGIANPIDYFGTDGMWGAGALMVGPLYSIPLNEKFELDFKGMFGYVLLTRKFDYSERDEATGTGFEAGIMLRYNFAQNWSFMTNLETFNTKLDIQPDKDPGVSLLNLSFGIAYRLR